MNFFQEYSKRANTQFAYNVEVIGIEFHGSYYEITVREPNGETFSFESNKIINSGGFSSDKVAALVGLDIKKFSYEIKLSKGQYWRISNPKRFNINHLIYPPPSKIDLGIHITPDLAGGLRLGPDSKYITSVDYNIDEASREVFFKSVSRYLDGLSIDDLVPDTSGIRPKLQGEKDDFADFVIRDEADKGFPGFINLIGIESPGLTACLAIAELVLESFKFQVSSK
jgi:L-2-hydroxyglutarate oxidase LhgO